MARTSTLDEAVFRLLFAAGHGMSRGAIRRALDAPECRVRESLQRLRIAGRIERGGPSGRIVWGLSGTLVIDASDGRPVQRRIDAAGAPRPVCTGARSVFDLVPKLYEVAL